jgi:hypothetical protein
MDSQTKRLLLIGAALATVAAAIFAPPAEEPVQPTHPVAQLPGSAGVSSTQVTSASTAFIPNKRNTLDEEPEDLFYVEKPPPPPVIVQKPAAPVAPPLPYMYMGKMIENGRLSIFLTRQDKPYVVHAGDVLDNQYRVDSISPPIMELTYLPLKQKQTLDIGATK